MNRKLVLNILMAIPFCSFAIDSVNGINERGFTTEQMDVMRKQASDFGMPMPGNGVIVKPMKQFKHYNLIKKSYDKDTKDIKKYGYIKKVDEQLDTLMNFKYVSKKMFAKSGNDKFDTGIRKNASEIKAAYDFKGIPAGSVDQILGAAPLGTYVREQGWSGVGQFFEDKNMGTCSFQEDNIKYSLGSTEVAKEVAGTQVNGKVTITSISGKPKKGFMYRVEWFDNTYFREINCANAEFDKEKINSIIELAKTIDNNS